MRRRPRVPFVVVSLLLVGWLSTAPVSAATLIGTAANEKIFGTHRRDVIKGGDGSLDVLFAKGNPDGRRNRDKVFGGPGLDILFGSSGRDVLKGEDGPGSLFDDDGRGGDKLIGGPEADTFYAADGAADTIVCGLGTDGVFADPADNVSADCEFVVTGSGGTTTYGTSTGEELNGGAAADAIFGLGGGDTLNGGELGDVLSGGRGVDTLTGGLGDDLLVDDDGSPGDILKGGEGSDNLYGADGALGTIDCGSSDGATDFVFADPEDSIENCEGADQVVQGIKVIV
jgi:Ca2+-binding RTX toxin-like protein